MEDRKDFFIEYSNNMQDVYKNIKEYPSIKCNELLFFDDMIADILSNKKQNNLLEVEK